MKIAFYGSDWSSDCRDSKEILERHKVEFEDYDLSRDSEYSRIAKQISGGSNIPVIRFGDGKFLINPSKEVLLEELRSREIIDPA